jgi:prophage regulatory protein
MPKYLRRHAVCERYGFPASTLYYWIEKGQFPRQVRLGERAVAWSVAELEVWERTRTSERDARAPER